MIVRVASSDDAILLQPVRKTSHLLIADDRAISGFGSSGRPPTGGTNCTAPYGPAGEKAVMPAPEHVVAEALRILKG